MPVEIWQQVEEWDKSNNNRGLNNGKKTKQSKTNMQKKNLKNTTNPNT